MGFLALYGDSANGIGLEPLMGTASTEAGVWWVAPVLVLLVLAGTVGAGLLWLDWPSRRAG